MAEWQPIETAPKDGTRFLFSNAEGHEGIGRYINCHAFAADSWGGVRYTIPHFWMPLPSPPANSPVLPTPISEDDGAATASKKGNHHV